MSQNKGLGKGLAALLQDLVEEEHKSETAAKSVVTKSGDIKEEAAQYQPKGSVFRSLTPIPISRANILTR